MDERERLQPDGHTPPIGAYSPGIAVDVRPGGRLVFVSGQVASDERGAVVAAGDLAGQAEYVFERLRAVLAAGGAGVEDLVSLVYYLRDGSDFTVFSAVRDRWLAAVRPSSTLLFVPRLAVEEHLVEISAVAYVAAAPG